MVIHPVLAHLLGHLNLNESLSCDIEWTVPGCSSASVLLQVAHPACKFGMVNCCIH